MDEVTRFRWSPRGDVQHIQDPEGKHVRYSDYKAIAEELDTARAALARIERQRAKWRAAKARQQRLKGNPLQYDPTQTSIFGEGHVHELSSKVAPVSDEGSGHDTAPQSTHVA